MSRVLITGGAGQLGAALTRRLLADPDYDVRISDGRAVPLWMREACEVHRGDLRNPNEAAAAAKGCSHVIHLACFAHAETYAESESPNSPLPTAEDSYAVLEYEALLNTAIVGAAVARGVERFVFVSSPLVFERAELFPTPEDHLRECLTPISARGFARLAGERLCVAAAEQRGMQYAICRPFDAYGAHERDEADQVEKANDVQAGEPHAHETPAHDLGGLIEQALAGSHPLTIFGGGKRTVTPTHVDDLARGIFAAIGEPTAANEDFNLAAEREISLAGLAELAWKKGAGAAEKLALEELPAREVDLARSYPSSAKARELLGWSAQIDLEEGIASIAEGRQGVRHDPATPAVVAG
ncbi:MAG TPA: NAD(P)-dependent oxidoreductase [Solirubrobacteraceae bacterium]|nr:NAD(P)-dependent oxidoreductase [Solirubrobacteraceae bacterium]